MDYVRQVSKREQEYILEVEDVNKEIQTKMVKAMAQAKETRVKKPVAKLAIAVVTRNSSTAA